MIAKRSIPINVKNDSGFTLIELVMATLIITVAVLGTLLGIQTATRHSADPMNVQQGIAIAESYLEEIVSKPFPTAALPCGAPAASRANYATLCDYKGIPVGGEVPTDATGTAIPGLGAFTVQVNIDDTTATLNGFTAAANQVLRVDVTVSRNFMPTMVFSVYRTRY